MPNRLADATSPYLLQHRDNPVEWEQWGPAALARAVAEDRPILVSIGYSACHWCHVMAHESFEDPATAALMNREFVCVKVDREERPDVDGIYMQAVQAMTGHGGWPLHAFLTPEGVPFFGGTYWPPTPRMNMPAFAEVLRSVAGAWRERRDDVVTNAEQLRAHLERVSTATPDPSDLSPAILDTALDALAPSFDARWGGFGGAPKFPQPAVIDTVLRHHHRTGDAGAAGMVRRTLDAMADGGIYDHVGGGFARYSVDAEWLVPHFEKMTYDNAQLLSIYLDAYRAFGETRYREVVEQTLAYVEREMSAPEGGFYSAQDADSEGEEGRFYVWDSAGIDAVLGPEDGRVVRAAFGVTERGNFEGRSILHRPRPWAAVGDDLGMTAAEVEAAVRAALPRLFAARAERVWPGRDDKVLLAWNGMMLRAFADAGRALDRPDLVARATRCATFLLTEMRDAEGRLSRTWKDGRTGVPAFLDDHANLIDGLLALAAATLDRRWLDDAVAIADTMVSQFHDPDSPLFFDTGLDHERLITRPRDLQDGATPSGNAVAAGVLIQIATLTGQTAYRDRAASILRAMAGAMADHPTAFGRYLSALDAYLATPRELVLAGDPAEPGTRALLAVASARYDPHLLIARSDPADPSLAAAYPILADRPRRDGLPTAYLCERMVCLPPVTGPADLAIQLEQGTAIAWSDV